MVQKTFNKTTVTTYPTTGYNHVSYVSSCILLTQHLLEFVLAFIVSVQCLYAGKLTS